MSEREAELWRTIDKLESTVVALRAENARLRAALIRVSKYAKAKQKGIK